VLHRDLSLWASWWPVFFLKFSPFDPSVEGSIDPRDYVDKFGRPDNLAAYFQKFLGGPANLLKHKDVRLCSICFGDTDLHTLEIAVSINGGTSLKRESRGSQKIRFLQKS